MGEDVTPSECAGVAAKRVPAAKAAPVVAPKEEAALAAGAPAPTAKAPVKKDAVAPEKVAILQCHPCAVRSTGRCSRGHPRERAPRFPKVTPSAMRSGRLIDALMHTFDDVRRQRPMSVETRLKLYYMFDFARHFSPPVLFCDTLRGLARTLFYLARLCDLLFDGNCVEHIFLLINIVLYGETSLTCQHCLVLVYPFETTPTPCTLR